MSARRSVPKVSFYFDDASIRAADFRSSKLQHRTSDEGRDRAEQHDRRQFVPHVEGYTHERVVWFVVSLDTGHEQGRLQ